MLNVKRATSGAETTVITARSPLLDLANGVVQRTEADGTITLLFTLLGLTLDELVDIVLDDAPTIFSKGVIEDPTFVIDVFTFDVDNPLSALQELATLASQELAVRRDGENGFLVDIIGQSGLFSSYGEIRQTVTDDVFLAASSPTTNFGGGVNFACQRGPGATDKVAVLKFDLTWLKGLPVRIATARLVFTSTGAGNGTNHVLELFPLRSAASGPFTGQPREIDEFQSTWNIHITGRSWATAGARAANDDRDQTNEWEETLADPTVAGNQIIFTGNNQAVTQTFADFIQSVIDGTEAFYKDGFARFVLDASGAGQTGKQTFMHSDDSLSVALRPALLITLAQDRPRFLFQKNLVGIGRETDERDLVNRIYAVGGGGPSQGIRLTLGTARWTVATVPTTTTFTLVDDAIFEDDHLVGNFVDDLGGGLFSITDTVEATQTVTTGTAHGLSPGDIIAFRLNSAGDELVFVESPSSQATFGLFQDVQVENDLPIVDNLVPNAAFRDFTGGTPDSWVALGSATLAQETDPIHTQIAASAVKVTTTAVVGDGIQSVAIPISAIDPRLFFSIQIFLFVESGGGVDIFLEHSVDGRFPVEGAEEAAFTTQLGVFIEVSIEGVEFSSGTLTINIVNKEATAGVFYVDGAQLLNLANKQPFFEKRSSVTLWQRALDALILKTVPKITHQLPQALDLTGVDDSVFPYDDVVLGADVLLDDRRLNINDLVSRVLRVRRELLQSSVLRMQLSNTLDTLIDQLTARERRTRKIELPPPPNQGFQAVTVSVIDTGEVLVAVTGGKRMRSYRFAVALDTAPTYGVVAFSGTISNVIDGSAVFTGFFLETGQVAFLRAVAFRQIGAANRPGATEVRSVSFTSGSTSLVRARVEKSVDQVVTTSPSAPVVPWDLEIYDLGNLHNATANTELLTAPVGGVYLCIFAIAWSVEGGGATGTVKRAIAEGFTAAVGTPSISRDYTKAGPFTGIGALLRTLVTASEQQEVQVQNATGDSITIEEEESFWQAIRIAVRSNQNRAWITGTLHAIATATNTIISFSLASDFERDDVGNMFDKAGAPTRITFQQAAPHLVFVQAPWDGAGVGGTSLRRIELLKDGTTVIAKAENQVGTSPSPGDIFVQTLSRLVMAPSVSDFVELRVRQETGASLDLSTPGTSIGTDEFAFQALELPGGSNSRAEVTLSAVEGTTTATPLAIPWDNEDVDVGSMVDIAGDPERITITQQGVYLLIGQIAWASNATGERRISIRKNGTLLVATERVEDPDGVWVGRAIVAMPAFIDDFFEVEVEQASGGGLNVTVADSFFQAIRIGNL